MMAAGIDWDQIFSMIAPRPVFMVYGTDDAGTPEVIGHKFRMTVLQDGPDFLCKHSGG